MLQTAENSSATGKRWKRRPGMIVWANNRKRRFEEWRKTIEQRLAELDAQRATLKARRQTGTRQRHAPQRCWRASSHRLEHGKDEEFCPALGRMARRELPDFLTRPGDKELFADLIGNAPAGETTGSAGDGRMSQGETCMGCVQEHDAAGRA